MWIETQVFLGVIDAARIAQSVIAPGEAIWHLAMGDVARPDVKVPTWQDVKDTAGSLKERAMVRLKTVGAAEVVGGVAMLGGMLAADGVLRAIGVDDGLPFPTGPATETRDGYLLFLTPERLVLAEVASLAEERPFAMPRCRSRVRLMQHWTPEAIPGAALSLTHTSLRFGERWRLTIGRDPAEQSFDFWKHPKAPDNLAQVAAIAARLTALRRAAP